MLMSLVYNDMGKKNTKNSNMLGELYFQ